MWAVNSFMVNKLCYSFKILGRGRISKRTSRGYQMYWSLKIWKGKEQKYKALAYLKGRAMPA